MKELLRWLLPRLPLPMLALAASYGVYQFALLFVPAWVAMAQASAFELVYISLATIETPSLNQRGKARAISVGAVAVSVLYNSLAGYFHRNGLGALPLWGEMVLAVLHGAPLAIVAYLVADLLLHKSLQEQQEGATEQPIATPALPNLLPSLQENATDSIPTRDEVAAEPPVALEQGEVAEPTLDELLLYFGKTRAELLEQLNRRELSGGTHEKLYVMLKQHAGLPNNITPERFAVLLAELKAGESDPAKPFDASAYGTIKDAVWAYMDSQPDAKIADLLQAFPGQQRGTLSGNLSKWREKQEEMVASANGHH